MAMFDGIRKALGLTTEADRSAGDSRMIELGAREDPAARFAVAFAEDLGRADAAAVRRAVPGVGRLSADERVRTAQIADALLVDAERFVRHGEDRGLGGDLGRASREASLHYLASSQLARVGTIEAATSPGFRLPQEGLVVEAAGRRHESNSVVVSRYLEASDAGERAVSASAAGLALHSGRFDRDRVYEAAGRPAPRGDAIPSPDDLREVSALAVARSRAGMLTPDRVVQLALLPANASAREGVEAARSGFGEQVDRVRIVPDFGEGLRAATRPEVAARRLDAFTSSPSRPRPEAVAPTVRDAAPREGVDRARAASPALAAAVAARGARMGG